MDRKSLALEWLAATMRLNRLGLALPSVTSRLASTKPSDLNLSSIRFASRRLKSNSGTLRALIAPGASAVCPTSRRMGNFDRSNFKATGFDLRGFGNAPGFGGTLATALNHALFLVSIDTNDTPTTATMPARL